MFAPQNPYKAAEFFEARRLRAEEGMPMKQIAAKLGVSVGSVHLWTKDIEISPEHVERNRVRARASATRTWIEKSRSRRLAFQEEGRKRARRADPFHQAGCFLYWAEGSKEPSRIQFANSDGDMVRFFVRFLHESLGVQRARSG